MHTVEPVLVVQVVGRSEAGHANVTDRLSLTNTSAEFCLGIIAGHVRIQRRYIPAVLQDDNPAIA